jgi:glycine/D-amino acid oxidase-like deaminating enzyme
MFFTPQAPPKDPEALLWAYDRLWETIPRYAEAEVVTYWSGLRTFAEDRQPVLGADPRVPGLHWCAGLGGHGMTIGLGAAQEVTKGLFNEKSSLLHRYGVQRLLDTASSTQEKVSRQSW